MLLVLVVWLPVVVLTGLDVSSTSTGVEVVLTVLMGVIVVLDVPAGAEVVSMGSNVFWMVVVVISGFVLIELVELAVVELPSVEEVEDEVVGVPKTVLVGVGSDKDKVDCKKEVSVVVTGSSTSNVVEMVEIELVGLVVVGDVVGDVMVEVPEIVVVVPEVDVVV